MLSKILQNNVVLTILSTVIFVFAYEPFSYAIGAFIFPILFTYVLLKCKSSKEAFWIGFLVQYISMLLGFYWVTFVLHEFGYLPWPVAFILFLIFCAFSALVFPFYSFSAYWIYQKFKINEKNLVHKVIFYSFSLPALFTVIEYFLPKIFPWKLGNTLYHWLYLTQVAEIGGLPLLSFMIFSFGTSLCFFLLNYKNIKALAVLVLPFLLITVSLVFSYQRMNAPIRDPKTIKVALIQANIGSLEKMESEKAGTSKVKTVIHKYTSQTQAVLSEKPDLILWPETAMPFQMDLHHLYSDTIRSFIKETQTSFIIGGYARSKLHWEKDYNAAFLFTPTKSLGDPAGIYYKNILLAFGEYLPMGEWFPKLYQYFPQISNFDRGTEQKPVILDDGTRIGVTICYEAIVPEFYRNTALENPQFIVNLTNDSWFGPTTETYLHGSLAVMRAIETRKPFIRVTNTGTSFVVDSYGHISHQTKIYVPETLIKNITFSQTPEITFYTRHGDWFVILLILLLVFNFFLLQYKR